MRAALALIGERGLGEVTHRAVAERAGVPLAATTYWFASKDELLGEALLLAAREETERLERLVLELAPHELGVEEWARAVAEVLGGALVADPERHVAFTELVMESTRRPALRAEVERWDVAHVRLAEMGLRSAGSGDPGRDAPIVVAAISGLMIAQLAHPQEDFVEGVFRPALERLFERLTAPTLAVDHA